MNANEFTHPTRGGSSGIGCGFHRRHIAPDDGGHETGIDLLPAHKDNVGRLDHGIGRFDHANKPSSLDETERITNGLRGHGVRIQKIEDRIQKPECFENFGRI